MRPDDSLAETWRKAATLDSSEPSRRASMLAKDYPQLGERMRALRVDAGASLATYAQLLNTSESVLRRYEQGIAPHPRLRDAEHLDEIYRANGWIKLSIVQLRSPDWDPWGESWAAAQHHCSWPAMLSSQVWIRFEPVAETKNEDHTFILNWGPWQHTFTTKLLSGLYVTTGKARDLDGISVTLTASCLDHPFHMLHGAGDIPEPTKPKLDISQSWSRVRP